MELILNWECDFCPSPKLFAQIICEKCESLFCTECALNVHSKRCEEMTYLVESLEYPFCLFAHAKRLLRNIKDSNLKASLEFRRKELFSLVRHKNVKGLIGFTREMGGFLE